MEKFPQTLSFPNSYPLLTLLPPKIRSFSLKRFEPDSNPFQNLTNLKKLSLLHKEQGGSLEFLPKEGLFWLMNDELRDSYLKASFDVKGMRNIISFKLLKVKHKLDGRDSLVKYVNLSIELKQNKRKLHEGFIRKEIKNWLVLNLIKEFKGVVPIYYNSWNEGDSFFIQFEDSPFETLRDFMRKGPLDITKLLSLIDKLLTFLKALHRENLAFLDLKPENILFDGKEVMIIGFQLLCGRFLAAGEEVVEGEARYLAPEFMDIPCKKVLDLGKTDLFALGIIIYEAICGKIAAETVEERILELEKHGLDERIFNLIEGLIRKDPDDREIVY